MKKITVVLLLFVLCAAAVLSACAPVPESPDCSTRFIAHRGLSSIYYENSEQAFLGAAKSSFFWGIETDFWLTADGVWVCAHDENPFEDPATRLPAITYAEAASLPLKQSEEYNTDNNDVYLCSAQRYLEICSQYGKTAVIELKYKAKKAELNSLLSFVEASIGLENAMFISFHYSVITDLKKLDDDVFAMVLTSNLIMTALYMEQSIDIGLSQAIVTNEMIAYAEQQGLLVDIWTVNDSEKAQEFVRQGVDFITTDFDFGAQ